VYAGPRAAGESGRAQGSATRMLCGCARPRSSRSRPACGRRATFSVVCLRPCCLRRS